VLKKDDAEHRIPEPWRNTFERIADAFVTGDFRLREHGIDDVAPIDADTASSIAANIDAYGGALAPLDDAVWATSVYRWMDGYWQVLVDLTTVSEPVSDLTLHATIRESDGPRLRIESVHVP
jgi:hypothetical protein